MNQVIKTKNYEIGSGNPAYIIAEIGSNHNGNYDLACELIEKAKDAYFFVDNPGGMVHTDCCMWTTVGDMIRLGEMLLNKGIFQGKEILPSGWVDQMTKSSKTNINYGMQIWLGNNFEPKRPYDSRMETFANIHSEAFKADDLFFMDGLGKQRIYMIPSESLVILRTGSQDSEWDDSRLPNIILEALNNK